MKINEFQNQCSVGSKVQHISTDNVGTILKMSTDKVRVLVLFDNGDKSWIDYYKLNLLSSNHSQK